MADDDNIVQFPGTQGALAQVLTSGGANPDQAARALQLSQASGIPSTLIADDIPNYEAQQKAQMGAEIVRRNPYLQAYVASHPLAAQVSNDDWGNLQTLTQAVSEFKKESAFNTAWQWFKAGVGDKPFGDLGNVLPDQTPEQAQFAKDHPGVDALMHSITTSKPARAVEIGLRTISGLMTGAAGGLGQLIDNLSGTKAGTGHALEALEAINDPGLWATVGSVPGVGTIGEAAGEVATAGLAQGLRRLVPWVTSDKPVPVGVHPIIDAVKAAEAEDDKEKLGEALKAVQASATKQRSEQFVAGLIHQISQDTIGIKADAIRELYGEDAPAPGDGVLGWVPGLGAKLAAAEATGGDVQVPLSEYLAKVDPKVAKQLEDFVRVRPEGMTVEEAKAPPQILPPETVEQAAIRLNDGRIFTGPNHVAAMEEAQKALGRADIIDEIAPVSTGMGGFITSRGRLIDRAEAARLAGVEGDWLRSEAVNTIRSAAGLEPHPVGAAVTPPGDRSLPAFDKPFEGAAPGFTGAQTDRMMKLLGKRQEADQAAALERAAQAARQRLSPQWNADRAEVRQGVVRDLQSRPDFTLDEMVRAGRKLDAASLSEEEKAALPRSYYTKGGWHVDDLESHFGEDGHVLVAQLAQIERARAESGLRPMDFRRRYIEAETDRIMEDRYGDFSKNVIEEAKDQVLSETQEELLHEQTLATAMKMSERGIAGGEQFPIDPAVYRRQRLEDFGELSLNEISSDRFLADAGRAGRAVVDAVSKDDLAEVFRQQQRHYNAILYAREAKAIEALREKKYEPLVKTLSARSNARIEQEYMDWTHDLLTRLGYQVKRGADDLREALDRSGHKDLRAFVESKWAHDLREIAVADFLMDPRFDLRGGNRSIDSLSVNEFKDLNDALTSLAHNGRDEKKIIAAGEAADLAEVKTNLGAALARYKTKAYDTETGKELGRLAAPREFLRNAVATNLGMETLIDNIDRYDPRGPWNQYVYRPLIEGSNHEARLIREVAGKLRAIEDGADLKEKITAPSPFRDPITNEPITLSRSGLRSALLNSGNDSNFHKLAGGRFRPQTTDPAMRKAEFEGFKSDVKNWIATNSTKADWDWAQKIWDLYEDLHQQSQTMYRNLAGVPPESIELSPIETPFGKYRGGYFPLIRDEIYGGEPAAVAKRDLEGAGFYRAVTWNGYTKARTGALYPLSLNLDSLPMTLGQIIHDITLRPAAVQVGKLVYDAKLKQALTLQVGKEYAEMFQPWLKDIINPRDFTGSANVVYFKRMLDALRANVQVSLIGLNPSTPLKHGPTALISSLAEVGLEGAGPYAEAVRSLFSVNDQTGLSNLEFARQASEEIQRRTRTWIETLTGSHQELLNGTGTWAHYRAFMSELGSAPVAFSDMMSTLPLWLAKYKMEMQEHGVYGDAVYAADKAVRRAHGSTADPYRPEIMRRPGLRWFTGFMTFMNDILNRNIETVWRAGEALGMAKEGEYGAAMREVPNLVGRVMAYVVAPAAIEEMVSPLTNSEHESWGAMAAKAVGYTLSSGLLGVRDIMNAVLNKDDPSVGLLSTLYKSATNIPRDFEAKHVRAGNVIKHAAGLAGVLTGLPAQAGRTAEFLYNVHAGAEHPQGPWGWLVGARYGTLKHHAPTAEKWWEGKER